MAVTGYRFAGTAANVDRDTKSAWESTNFAKSDDTNYASNPGTKNQYSDWLRLTNFGFTSTDIPDGSTINGIEFIVCRYSQLANSLCDSALYLYANGAVGNNLASATKWPQTTPTEATYGGSTNMCGTSLTQADIVANTFGVSLSVLENGVGDSDASVDYITIRVYYTAGGAGSLPLKNVFGRPFSGVFR